MSKLSRFKGDILQARVFNYPRTKLRSTQQKFGSCSVSGAERSTQPTAVWNARLLLPPRERNSSTNSFLPSSTLLWSSCWASSSRHIFGLLSALHPMEGCQEPLRLINRHRWLAFPPFARSPSHGYYSTKTALFCRCSRVIKHWRCAAVWISLICVRNEGQGFSCPLETFTGHKGS